MNWKKLVIGIALCLAIIMMSSQSAFAAFKQTNEITVTTLATSLSTFLLGSTVGPGGDLYVPDGQDGEIWRVDPRTGEVELFASGLPKAILIGDQGGPGDIVFVGSTAYVMVTLVADDIGGTEVVGVYRVDGPTNFTVIADIGTWSRNNLPDTPIFLDTGAQISMQAYKDGLLVVDGHHNRVLFVDVNEVDDITELATFPDVVPTGTDLWGNRIYLGLAGPVPHLPEDGKVVVLDPQTFEPTEIASGLRLIVDVEFGPGRTLYALSNGFWDGPFDGAPANPNTGQLARVNDDGTFTILVDPLDRPTSMEFIGNTAYVTLLNGTILMIENLPK